MSRLKPETAWARLAENTRLPAKARVMALEQIPRPSLAMLRRLLAAESTPPKLRLLAAQKYTLAVARKELIRNARTRQKQAKTDHQ
jgi:hypothetical protein